MNNHIFKVWVDSDADINQGKYIIEYSSLKNKKHLIKRLFSNRVNDFAKNPKRIQELLYLDKPDIIITYQKSENDIEIPILCIEFSEQTPMGQNTYQRFPRAVASAEAKVPFVIVFPERDWVERKNIENSGWEYASPFIFNGLKKLSDYHELPIISINWACENKKVSYKGYKYYDDKYPNMPDSKSSQIKDMFSFIELILENAIYERQVKDLFKHRIIQNLLSDLESKIYSKGKDFIKKVPSKSSGFFLETVELKSYILEKSSLTKFDYTKLPDYIKNRNKSLIFFTKTNNFRADPYTGTMLVYDYSFCRFGPKKTDRHTNLIIHFPNITINDVKKKYSYYYQSRCPFRNDYNCDSQYLTLHLRDGCKFTKQKEIRIYFYFADLIILNDCVLY